MKGATAVLVLAAAGSVAARSHRHRHHHAKRDGPDTTVVTVPGPTVVAYELDGEVINEKKACGGIDEGSLIWADGKAHDDACGSAQGKFFEKEETSSSSPTPAPSSSAPPSSPPAPSSTPSNPVGDLIDDILPPPLGGGDDGPSGGEGLDKDFPDGKLSCSEFPSEYGPLNLKYLGLGGWSGVQHVEKSGMSFSAIHTAIEGDGCREGSMCSYACPPGYQKSQWPEAQGSTGQSVGGLECSGGKLHLTNSKLSKKLCVPGAGNVQVKNTMSKAVSVCRTDYPGTESEVVPLSAAPGSTEELTCPDSSKYYKWQDKDTSAQYYVNPKGVPTEKACQWGDSSEDIGNFAPVNLGAGKKDGATWLSIFQNKPTTDAKLDYKIEIKGDNLSGSCKYANGKYTSLTGSNSDGCTVQLLSGTATFVFSD